MFVPPAIIHSKERTALETERFKRRAMDESLRRDSSLTNWMNQYGSSILKMLNSTQDPTSTREGQVIDTQLSNLDAEINKGVDPSYLKAIGTLEADVGNIHNKGAGARYEAQLAMARGAATTASAQYGNIGSASAQAVQAGAQGIAMQDAFMREGQAERQATLDRVQARGAVVDAYAGMESARQGLYGLRQQGIGLRLKQQEIAQQIRQSNISSAIAAFSTIMNVKPVDTSFV
jgi:hypothetical protein